MLRLADAPRTRRRGWRRLRHALRPFFSRPLLWLGVRTLPVLYVAYMAFVWRTSRVEIGEFERVHDIVGEHGGAVSLFLHQDVMLMGYGVPTLGLPLYTLASVGDAGEIITRALELSGFRVFRGGAASRASRRRLGVLRPMIEYMRANTGVMVGITVDGSKGPVYEMKEGGIAIARACGKPVVIARICSKPCIRLRTWDRTAIPLPFSRIEGRLLGPFFPPDEASGEEAAERFRLECERDLIELAGASHDRFGQQRPPELVSAGARNQAALEGLARRD
jgi:lysophospholipid acyltransferase (LPLAT)-like uncharacterized protein